MLEKHQLTGTNFNEWFRALKLVMRTKKLQDVFETALPPAPAARADAQALADWAVLFYHHDKVACLMLGTMYPKLYQQFKHNSPLEMVAELQKMYGKPPEPSDNTGKSTCVLRICCCLSILMNRRVTIQNNFPQRVVSHQEVLFNPNLLKIKLIRIQNRQLGSRNNLRTERIHEKRKESVRTQKAPDRLCLNVEIDPDRLCFNVEVEEHSLRDLNEPANYKAALSDPEFEKWLVAMNAEMQSMYDNKVWRLVVLPPNEKVVKSKWIYKKKMDMHDKVHIYKVGLVAKGCTQTYGVDYEETFSHVADIRAIRILIAIAAYYDYEIWKIDEIAFLNGFLKEEIYMEQPEGEAAFILGIKIYRYISRRLIGLSQNAYLDKILKRYRMDNSKRGSIPMQVDLYLSKSQCATTFIKMKRMQNVPYASAIGSNIYAVRCTRPDVAFAQNITSQFQHNSELRVNCYCDAVFETDRDDTKSQTGYVFILNGGAVIKKFIDELGVVPSNDYLIKMNCDNSAAIIMAKESGIHKGARHF
nr:hypothetical protein [Tanacetum cinerariifolium]